MNNNVEISHYVVNGNVFVLFEDAQSYCDNNNIDYSMIVKTKLIEGTKYARKCDCCGSGMNEGYVIGDGERYYCSEECLNTLYTNEEWQEIYDNEDGYYSEWEQGYDDQYIVENGVLIEIEG